MSSIFPTILLIAVGGKNCWLHAFLKGADLTIIPTDSHIIDTVGPEKSFKFYRKLFSFSKLNCFIVLFSLKKNAILFFFLLGFIPYIHTYTSPRNNYEIHALVGCSFRGLIH